MIEDTLEDNRKEKPQLERKKEDIDSEMVLINCLEPSKLIVIPVNINGRFYQGMIDSGTIHSFINKSVVEENNMSWVKGEMKEIIGFGECKMKTNGKAKTELSIGDLKKNCECNVVENNCMKYDLILGLDFLTTNNVEINLEKKIMRMGKQDNLNVVILFDDEFKIKNMRYNNVPVYSKKKKIVKENESVAISFGISDFKKDDGVYYFEGNENGNLKFHPGITVFGNKIVCENLTSKIRKIKKNEIIGCMSMLVEEKEITMEDKENWTKEALKEKISLSGKLLQEHEKEKVYEMLVKVQEALSLGDSDIGEANISPHVIKLNNYSPVWQKPRSFAPPINQEIENQCQQLLSEDIIEYSSSKWSSPVVPVKKPDGSLRLCIDYRKLNSITEGEQFPMPSLNKCLFGGSEMKYFTTLDLVKGYYQVPLAADCKDLTAFTTSANHYQFKRLPFGLKNAAIAFQRMMQQIIAPIKSNNVIIYIDDILIMTETFEEHLKLVQKVLATLKTYNIKIKVPKCKFFQDNVHFLGHKISAEGIRKSEDYVMKVRDFPKPQTVTEMRKFLGLVNFQRKFIPKCSEVMKSLTEITGGQKKAKIEWTEERETAFKRLKEEISKEVILTYPNYSEKAPPLELYVDASGVGAGACLMQEQNGIYRVIGYGSMCFSTTQCRYSTIERELAAIQWGCQNFKSFLFGVKFMLFTDHKPLIYMNNMATHSSRIQRTLELLAEFDFTIKYIPGLENTAADVLSRMEGDNLPDDFQVGLPKEFIILERIEGGGNSMFLAMIAAMKLVFDEDKMPEDHLEIRKRVINELIREPAKYKLLNNKCEKKN